MINKTTKLMLAMAVGGLMLVNLQAAEAAPSFYKCKTGYSFNINNAKTGARCEKTTGSQVLPISCPSVTILGKSIGTFAQTKRGKDRCAGRGVGSVQTSHDPLGCSVGFTYTQNYSGHKDKCVKSGKLVIEAPTVKFR